MRFAYRIRRAHCWSATKTARSSALGLVYLPTTGFCAEGTSPLESLPSDWVAWHFTDVGNIQSIANIGAVVCHGAGVAHVDLADADIKRNRLLRPVSLPPPYPTSVVGHHVPFYFAPRSPMLYRVWKERGDQESLAFLGVRVGDVADQGLVWCASNGNARSKFTEFSNDLSTLREFVDTHALTEKWWTSEEDPDLGRRRQSEMLVHRSVPLGAVRYVVCKTEERLSEVRAILEPRGAGISFLVLPSNYF
ncbi:DUF4433 domain-containing protein (plasmid) [Rhodococcus opacus]|uniref:DUF4433 domain-containing protein n=1 Tax=Rhodococcus opacus TaxID=37919 RepID=UPI0034D2F240